MTPLELALRVYQTEPCAHTFAEDLDAHLTNGYVFSTPDYFIMGRPVVRSAPSTHNLDPFVSYNRSESHAWLEWLFCIRSATRRARRQREARSAAFWAGTEAQP